MNVAVLISQDHNIHYRAVFHWYVKFYHKKRSVSSSELTDLFLFVRELFHSPYICSMSRKGNCYDNAPIESFWGKLKQECLYHQRFKTRAQARDAVFEYIEVFYNRQRLHSTLGYQIPMNLLKAT